MGFLNAFFSMFRVGRSTLKEKGDTRKKTRKEQEEEDEEETEELVALDII